MQFSVEIRVAGDGLPSRDIVVTSDEGDERFDEAVGRAIRLVEDEAVLTLFEPRIEEWEPSWTWIGRSADDVTDGVELDWDLGGDGLTVAHAQRFFGDLASTGTPQIRLTYSGRGGDEWQVFTSVLEVVVGAPTVYGSLRLAIDAKRQVVQALNKKNRRLYAEWRDFGHGRVGMELEQAVRSEEFWETAIFKIRFGATDEGASKLLRSLGYTPRSFNPNPKYWIDEPKEE